MQLILFDDDSRNQLLPFTHTRPLADLRCGIFTFRERWERLMMAPSATRTVPYLQSLFPSARDSQDQLWILGSVFATRQLADFLEKLAPGQRVMHKDTMIAARITRETTHPENSDPEFLSLQTVSPDNIEIKKINYTWDLFSLNDWAIRHDFELLTANKMSATLPDHVVVKGAENLFIETGATVEPGAVINASTGPVYIGHHASILEGVLIRGPLAVCDHAVIKMGAKIYGATTIGSNCKVGGEISNVIFQANSNKGHDGYLGNAVIGEWCNLGADTNCSNLKNNYDHIKIWDEHKNRSVHTGLQFCGLMMGDHSKCAINTMFNTGTVVGVSANIFGSGFPDRFVPSFTWGGAEGMKIYDFDRAMDAAQKMMARRDRQLSREEITMYRHIFDQTTHQRT